MAAADPSEILTKHRHDATRLVQILRDVMAAEGYLSTKTITAVAEALEAPARTRRGRRRLLLVLRAGAPRAVSRALQRQHHRRDGGEPRSCGSACSTPSDIEPRRGQPRRPRERRRHVVHRPLRSGPGPARQRARHRSPHAGAHRRHLVAHPRRRAGGGVAGQPLSHRLAHRAEGPAPCNARSRRGEALAAAIARGAEATARAREALEPAWSRRRRLRRPASSGRPAASAPGDERYVVCNADEGEPGTFKDRVLLADHADLVLEGMTVAAFAIGAKKGFLYLRGEYPFLERAARGDAGRAPARRAARARTSSARSGFDFDLEIHWGAGAYVCGEESALIESLEGKRGIPRNRPPYPVTHGYLQKPTVVNNVETLAAAALVATHGARLAALARHREVRRHQDPLACRATSRAPASTSTRSASPCEQVLDDCRRREHAGRPGRRPVGHAARAPANSAAASPSRTSRARARSWCSTRTRDMLEVVDNFARFFAHESCGFCTPCRVGTTLVSR